jgi:TPR repeat protein
LLIRRAASILQYMSRTTAPTGFFLAFVIALMLFAATPVVAGDEEDAWAAYKAGDHQTAFRLWKRSAEQGDVAAQAKVGTSYLEGTGVPRSYVDAYAWLNIAAAQGGAWFLQSAPVAIRNHIDAITKLMTPAQIAEAQKLSRELWKKYVVPFRKE